MSKIRQKSTSENKYPITSNEGEETDFEGKDRKAIGE